MFSRWSAKLRKGTVRNAQGNPAYDWKVQELWEDYPAPDYDAVHTYCSVIFETGGKQFCYRTRNPELQVGDYVYVPVGYNREERAARIVKMENYVGRFAPYPLEKTKYIERKISKEEWVTKGIKIQI